MKKSNRFFIWLTIVIAIVISLPSIFWFSKGELLAHGPFFPWPDWTSSWWIATRYLYTWADGALGSINTEPSGFLYVAVLTIVTQVSHLLSLGQGGVFFFGYIAIFLSMVYLIRVLKQSYFAAVFAGAIYLLNPIIFSGLPIEIINLKLIPFNIATPLIVAMLIKLFGSKKWPKQLSLFVFMSFFPSSLSYSSLQYFTLHLLIISIFCIIELIKTLGNRKISVLVMIKSFLVVFFFFLVNTYWLLPLLSNIGSSFSSRAEPGISDSRLLYYLSATIPNSLRMLQYPSQVQVSPWLNYYFHPIIIIISFSLVIAGLFSLLIKKNKNKALFAVILLLIGLFLSKGILPFFSDIGKFIFLTFPYITRLFRNPTYFGSLVAFSTSILFGLTAGTYLDWLTKKKKSFLLAGSLTIIPFLLIIYGWQYIIGAPIKKVTTFSVIQATKVPQSFIEATRFIRNDPDDFRIISIPMFVSGRGNSVTYNWSGMYRGVGPAGVWSTKSTFVPTDQKIDDTTRDIFAPTKSSITQDEWAEQIQSKNVKYITLHQDADVPRYGLDGDNEYRREEINSFIRNSPYLERVMGNDQVEVFRLKDQYFLPHIYADGISAPKVIFQKINPTKYRVQVENVSQSFDLVFLESFHSGWKVFIDDSKKTVGEKQHSLFGGYANSWKINPIDIEDQPSVSLTIKFTPQKYVIIGWAISLSTLIFFLIVWLKAKTTKG